MVSVGLELVADGTNVLVEVTLESSGNFRPNGINLARKGFQSTILTLKGACWFMLKLWDQMSSFDLIVSLDLKS